MDYSAIIPTMNEAQIEEKLQQGINEILDNPEYPGENDIFNATDIAIQRATFPVEMFLSTTKDVYDVQDDIKIKGFPTRIKNIFSDVEKTLFNVYNAGFKKLKDAFKSLPEEKRTDEMLYHLNKNALEKIRYQCSFPFSKSVNPEEIKANCEEYVQMVADFSESVKNNPDKYLKIFISLFNSDALDRCREILNTAWLATNKSYNPAAETYFDKILSITDSFRDKTMQCNKILDDERDSTNFELSNSEPVFGVDNMHDDHDEINER